MNVVDIDNFTGCVQMALRIYVLGFHWRKVLGIMYASSTARSQPECLVSLIHGQMNRTVKTQNKQLWWEFSHYNEHRSPFIYCLSVPVEPKILSSNENFKDFKSVRHEVIIGDNLETLERTAVYVRCPATGNPAPKVTWKKSGSLDPRSLRIVNNTLVLLNSTWSDSGTYSCTASNGAGADEKSTNLNFIGMQI